MITIKLFGEMATKFTDTFTAEVRTVREAIACLEINFEGFREYLLRSGERGVAFKVLVGDTWELAKDEEVFLPVPQQRDICITPVVAGSGRILTGAALIGLAFTGVGAIVGLSSFQLGLMGALLLVQGLFGGQTKAPDPEEADVRSYVFNGPVNTINTGGRVPLVFGTVLTGSQVISASITSYQVPG